MPIRTFSPTTESTEISMSSPIMMLWLDLRVKTSNFDAPFLFIDRTIGVSPKRRNGKHSYRIGGTLCDALFARSSAAPNSPAA